MLALPLASVSLKCVNMNSMNSIHVRISFLSSDSLLNYDLVIYTYFFLYGSLKHNNCKLTFDTNLYNYYSNIIF